MGNEKALLTQYNTLYKENDEIYRIAAKTLGLSACAFWILYALREEEGLIQSELCHTLCLPKQTIHSALKKLENDGFIKLSSGKDRRAKYLSLTKKGTELAKETVDRVIQSELNAFAGFTDLEQQEFIRLFQKYTELLKAGMMNLNNESIKIK
ncbi:MAG: MarR family transcriptional regulator [Clostridium sp.]|nr:MarR family transcriptional regulator [Clostridium sp.]MCM1173373.1 MarR family transcriptional regulator [Clostridium sp.]MCM1209718.1 MarR family transcriptional regulator [Ruminococcus sp.]